MAYLELDADELTTFIDHIIANNISLQAKGKPPVSVEINGVSGLGKTSIIRDLAKAHDLSFVKINLAQIEELGDLVGYPVKQYEMCITIPERIVELEGRQILHPAKEECIWVDEPALPQFTLQGYRFTNKHRMSYAQPEWVPTDAGSKGGILLLDDWNRADMRFVQACMELINEQSYISWKLPPKWNVFMTANPEDTDYIVNSIDKAHRTRFITMGMKWNAKCWAAWAELQGVDTRCINFLLLNPEIVSNSGASGVNPRSLTTYFNAISGIKDFSEKESLGLIQIIGEGSVGGEVASMFTSFIHNGLHKLITPEDILLHQDEDYVLKRMHESFHPDGKNYREDIANITAMRLANFTNNYANYHSITPGILARISTLIKDPNILPHDQKYFIMKRLIGANKTKFEKLLHDTEIMQYLLK